MLYDRDYMRDREKRSPWDWLKPNGSIVKALIVANIAVFLLDMLSGGLLAKIFLLHPWYVSQWELWRLVTYQFVHGNFFHLFCNMYGLWIFGRGVQQLLGPRRFLQLYLVSGIVGGGLWLLANWWGSGMMVMMDSAGKLYQTPYGNLDQIANTLTESGMRLKMLSGGCVGASGALFGVMASAAMAFPDARISLLFPPVSLRMKTFIWVYALLEVVLLFDKTSNVAHLAHLGGMLGAFIYMRRLRRGDQFSLGGWFGKILGGFKRRRHRRQPSMNFPNDDDGPTSNEVDRVLEKMSTAGYESLTAAEREILEQASRRLRQQG
ncbi:MAG: rhomboid family intramembrane serine protease [Lentisphaeria bacterium]|nr:rhomboid family intramembrane serine protease [Lentisphaeria bacterium]